MSLPVWASQNRATFTSLDVQCSICGRRFARQDHLDRHTPACKRKRDEAQARPQQKLLLRPPKLQDEEPDGMISAPILQGPRQLRKLLTSQVPGALYSRKPNKVQRYALQGFEKAQVSLTCWISDLADAEG